jgi:SAM-dependent methyltransferase
MRLTSTKERAEFLALLGASLASRVLEPEDEALPHPDDSFDAVLCIDGIAALRDRGAALASWARVVKPGRRILYTDPAIVAGLVTSEELAIRSSMGFTVFSPQGENESLIDGAGLRILRADDATDSMAEVAASRRADRATREAALVADEGRERFDSVQRWLEMTHRLAAERRLARIAFLLEKFA